jgi:hypothetical protein
MFLNPRFRRERMLNGVYTVCIYYSLNQIYCMVLKYQQFTGSKKGEKSQCTQSYGVLNFGIQTSGIRRACVYNCN